MAADVKLRLAPFNMQVKTLASSRDWDGLLALATEKKAAVGPETLVAIVKEAGAPETVTAR